MLGSRSRMRIAADGIAGLLLVAGALACWAGEPGVFLLDGERDIQHAGVAAIVIGVVLGTWDRHECARR